MAGNTALVVGISGITGRALAEYLCGLGGWTVLGISRRAHGELGEIRRADVDLTNADATAEAVGRLGRPTHLYFVTWARQSTELENCEMNGRMFRNAVEAAAASGELRHVALVTGLKHYMGSFENYAASELETPFSEEMPRVAGPNFYYTQEDILFELAARSGFTWSVARPHTIIGYAPGNAMNLSTSLAVYATLCRESGRKFVFPGSPEQYGGLTDMTDAGLLARHLVWSSTTPAAANTAFNVVNGDVFRWKKLWRQIADYFGIEVGIYPGEAQKLAQSLADAGPEWDRIVRKYHLCPNKITEIAPWWHVDADLGRTRETLTDMSLSRERGFLDYQRTSAAVLSVFERLREARVIP
ncbi:MAG: SDR family oxidoreductase [Acetobacteraceae bacterium]